MKYPVQSGRNIIPVLSFCGALILLGCSSDSYLEDADLEVYEIIQDKQQVVLGEAETFQVDPGENVRDLEDEAKMTYVADGGSESLEDPGEPEDTTGVADTDEIKELLGFETLPVEEGQPPLKINLDQSLEIAFRINRDFKDRKEDLYLEALDLTFQRHLWTPQLSGILSGELARTGADERYRSGDASFSMSQLLSTGGEISLGFLSEVIYFYSPDTNDSSSSIFSFDFLQPLWRGFGSLVAKENLTQAERNVAYEVRSFARFKRSFAVDIASTYYQVLQQKDRVENQLLNFENLKTNAERSRLMAEAGRLPTFQLDQVQQDLLSAENSWIRAQQQYEEQIDSFKIDLGLPTEIKLELDSDDLKILSEGGLNHPEIDLEKSVAYALENRLDLMNQSDGVEDAKRRVLLAKDGLGPDLDFSFSYSVGTEPSKPLKFETNHPSYGAGLRLDLPLDRKSERNSFRQSLITLERQKRNLSLLEDNIKQQVRRSYRTLNQAKESYEIQKIALELAEKRVESTNILLQAGRAESRDVLDSQEDLLAAQNDLTAAIVEHTIARMDFFLDIEFLRVDEHGAVSSLDLNEPESNPQYKRGPKDNGNPDDGTQTETGE